MSECRFDYRGCCTVHSIIDTDPRAENPITGGPSFINAPAALCTHAAAALNEGRNGLRNAAEGVLKVLDPRAALADFGRMTDEEIRASLEASRRIAGALQARVRELELENGRLGDRFREGSADVEEADRRLDNLLTEMAQMEGQMVSVETAKILTAAIVRLDREKAEAEQKLRDKAAEKMPHSFVKMNWACGHEGGAACVTCKEETEAGLSRAEATVEKMREALEFVAGGHTISGYKGPDANPLIALAQEVIHGAQTTARAALAAGEGEGQR